MRSALRALVALSLAGVLAGCTGGSSVIDQAGSSTVEPVAKKWAEEFGSDIGADIVVAGGGTGSGFTKLCAGEIDIADASRPIKQEEKDACAANGVTPFELEVAIDGLAVVVDKDNTFVDHLTVAELHRIWTADTTKQANTWKALRPAWPDQRIDLYGPGPNSGTFDYFLEAVIHPTDGKESRGRQDFTKNEDDNTLVTGVSRSANGLGYFGLAYARENSDKVRIVPIDDGKSDNGAGPMEPTDANVEQGRYAPLARPLYMYVDGKPEGAIKAYFEKALSDEGQAMVSDVGYIRLPEARQAEMLGRIA